MSEHYEEDGRCGFCYEEYPCEGSKGSIYSGVHKWQTEHRRNQYELSRQRETLEEDTINYLFEELGYDLRYPRASQTMTLKREIVLELLARIYDLERERSDHAKPAVTAQVERRRHVQSRVP